MLSERNLGCIGMENFGLRRDGIIAAELRMVCSVQILHITQHLLAKFILNRYSVFITAGDTQIIPHQQLLLRI